MDSLAEVVRSILLNGFVPLRIWAAMPFFLAVWITGRIKERHADMTPYGHDWIVAALKQMQCFWAQMGIYNVALIYWWIELRAGQYYGLQPWFTLGVLGWVIPLNGMFMMRWAGRSERSALIWAWVLGVPSALATLAMLGAIAIYSLGRSIPLP